MRITDILSFSINAVMKGRLRVTLTITAVAIGVCSVSMISTLGEAGTSAIDRELDKMGLECLSVFANNETSKLYADDAEFLEKELEEVETASPIVMEYGAYHLKGAQNQAVFWGIDSDVASVLGLSVLFGRLPNKDDVKTQRNCAVIDAELAKKHYFRENIVGKTITINLKEKKKKIEIIGVVAPQKDALNQMVGGVIPDFIYLPYTTLNQMRASHDITQIAIAGNDELDKDHITEIMNRRNQGEYHTENIAGYVGGFRSAVSVIALILSAIGGISLCVAGLGIMNAMLASVAERKREIGICMAVGAQQKDIVFCFLAEGMIISLFGGMIGGGITAGIIASIGKLFHITIHMNIKLFLLVEIIAIICGIIFSLIPAIRASKQDPIQVLRTE